MLDRHLFALVGTKPLLSFSGHPDHNPARFVDGACLRYVLSWIPGSVDRTLMQSRAAQLCNLLGQQSLQVFAFSMLITPFEAHATSAFPALVQIPVTLLTVLSLYLPARLHQVYRGRTPKAAPAQPLQFQHQPVALQQVELPALVGAVARAARLRTLRRNLNRSSAATLTNVTSHQIYSTLLRMISTPREHYLTSCATRAPLRIGIVVECLDRVPAFAAKIIADIQASNFAEIGLVLEVNRQQPTATPHVLYRLYLRLDERMRPSNDPLAPLDCRDTLAGVEILQADLKVREGCGELSPANSITEIRSKKLDVLVALIGGPALIDLSGELPYGVWWLSPGDNEFYRGGPSDFWEIREHNPISAVTLCAAYAHTKDYLVLAKALFATEQTISISRNRYLPYWGSTELIIGKLHDLHEFGWQLLLQTAKAATSYKGRRPLDGYPSNVEMASWLGPILVKKALSYPFRKKVVQHWKIAVRANAPSLFEPDTSHCGFRWIDPPKGHSWADPFVFEHESKYWLFFEDYSYETMRGSIACAEISDDGVVRGAPLVCLENRDCHYSYPHVFREGSEILMIPESFESNSVDLYCCRRFPNEWVHDSILMQGRFVDTTLWQAEGLWWLATTSAEPAPGAGFLWLYYSSSLRGKWQLHPANPISTDIRTSRGAGRVFRDGNRLIRPSQSGAPTYGYSLTFHEITELTPQRYAERPMKTIGPEHWPGLAGVHTYNRNAQLEFIDGRTPVSLERLKSWRDANPDSADP